MRGRHEMAAVPGIVLRLGAVRDGELQRLDPRTMSCFAEALRDPPASVTMAQGGGRR